jgi:hypothetical protein
VGVGLLLEVTVRLLVIPGSVDVVNGLLSATTWRTVGILVAVTVPPDESFECAGNKGRPARVEPNRLNFGGSNA